MPIHEEVLRTLLENAFPDGLIEIHDPMGDKNHFTIRVFTPSFEGKTRLQQHQSVYRILQDSLLRGDLHAVSLETGVAVPKRKEV